jgi:hypothetical protein
MPDMFHVIAMSPPFGVTGKLVTLASINAINGDELASPLSEYIIRDVIAAPVGTAVNDTLPPLNTPFEKDLDPITAGVVPVTVEAITDE